MMKRYQLIFLGLLSSVIARCQDHVVLINGDTLEGKMASMRSGIVVLISGAGTKTISTDFITEVFRDDMRVTLHPKLHELVSPGSFRDFGSNVLIVNSQGTKAQEAKSLFPNATVRTVKTSVFVSKVPVRTEFFLKSMLDYNGKAVDMDYRQLQFLSLACNAFLVEASWSGNEVTYKLYSNHIPDESIGEFVTSKTFELDYSMRNGGYQWMEKRFTLAFDSKGTCQMVQKKQRNVFAYSVAESKLVFSDMDNIKKNSSPASYDVVSLNQDAIRYTMFNGSDDIITKQLTVVKR